MNRSTNLFSSILFAIGLVLLIVSGRIDKALQNTSGCDMEAHKQITKLNKGVSILGTIFLVLSLSYMTMMYKCTCQEGMTSMSNNMFAGAIVAMSIVIIVLGSMIHAQHNKCHEAGKLGVWIWVLGLGMLIYSLGSMAKERGMGSSMVARMPRF